MITGISEVVLNVDDLPQMREFYVEVMGFPIYREVSLETEQANPDGDPTISFLKICDTDTPLGRDKHPQLMVLIDYKRHVHARNRLAGRDVSRSNLNHVAFEIPPDLYDHHRDRLDSMGFEMTFSEFPSMNAKAIFFKDPEGNSLELICKV